MSDSDSDSNSPHISHKNSSEIAADIGQFLRQRQDNGKKGRKSKANINNNDGPLAPFIKVARWIPLAIDPFVNLHDVFMMGLQGRSGQRERMTVDEQYKCIVFENIVPLMPDLVSIISEFSKDAKTFQAMVTQMTKAVAGVRSSDAMTFKRSMSTYIAPNEESKAQYLIPDFGQKQLWGWNHRVTGRFMCPMRLLSKFDANPQEFLDKVHSGKRSIRASDYPMFLYDESKYDPRNVYSGLFQGQLLLKFYRHVFTGPSSWNNGKSSGGKKPRGLVNRLEEPTARTIAYVAVMVRWALSASKDFCTNDDNGFNLVDLYHNILIAFNERIDYKGDVVLEKSTQEWIEATLRWWKIHVPGLQVGRMNITAGDYYATETDEESDLHKLKARRQIRTERDDSVIDPLLKEPQGTQQGFVSGSPSTAHATIGLAPNVTAQAGHALVAPGAVGQATTGSPSASTATQPTFEPSTTIFRAAPATPAPLATPAPPADPCSTQAAPAARRVNKRPNAPNRSTSTLTLSDDAMDGELTPQASPHTSPALKRAKAHIPKPRPVSIRKSTRNKH